MFFQFLAMAATIILIGATAFALWPTVATERMLGHSFRLSVVPAAAAAGTQTAGGALVGLVTALAGMGALAILLGAGGSASLARNEEEHRARRSQEVREALMVAGYAAAFAAGHYLA